MTLIQQQRYHCVNLRNKDTQTTIFFHFLKFNKEGTFFVGHVDKQNTKSLSILNFEPKIEKIIKYFNHIYLNFFYHNDCY